MSDADVGKLVVDLGGDGEEFLGMTEDTIDRINELGVVIDKTDLKMQALRVTQERAAAAQLRAYQQQVEHGNAMSEHGGAFGNNSMVRTLGDSLDAVTGHSGWVRMLTAINHMGAGIAAIGLGAGLALKLFESWRERLEENRKAQIEHNAEVQKLGEKYEQAAKSQRLLTEGGKQALGYQFEAQARLDQANRELAEMEHHSHTILGIWDRMENVAEYLASGLGHKGVSQESTQDVAAQLAMTKQADAVEAVARQQAFADAEHKKALQQQTVELKDQVQLARLAAMPDGPQKQMAMEVANEQADRHKMLNERDNKIASAQNNIKEQGISEGQTPAGIAVRQKQAELEIRSEYDEKINAQDQINAYKRQAIQMSYGLETLSETRSLGDKWIELQSMGYERALALLQKHNAEKIKDFQTAGRSTLYQEQINAAEEQKIIKDHQRDVNDAYQDITHQLQSATHAVSESEIAWEKMQISLRRQLSLSDAEMKKFEKQFFAMRQAQADKPLHDEIDQMNISLDLANHKISDLEAAYRRMKLANREASDDLVQAAAVAQEKVRLTEWVRGELANLPVTGVIQQMQDYVRQINEAIQAGVLSTTDAQKLIKQKAFDTGLTRPIDVGQFGGSSSGWRAGQVDVHAINMNEPLNSLKMSTDKNGQILVDIKTNTQRMADREHLH